MEMIANVVRNERDDRQHEVRVMLIGREVDPSLAGLLRHCNNDASATESDVTLSETNHDEQYYRSVSEKGSVKSDDAGAKGIVHEVPSGARAHDEDRQNVYEDPAERIACATLARVRRLNGRGGSDSNISSITLPSFLDGSKPSSLSSIMLSPFRGGSKPNSLRSLRCSGRCSIAQSALLGNLSLSSASAFIIFLLPSLPPWQPLGQPAFIRWLRWTWLRTPRFLATGS
jgi:hypothetical protein